MVGEGFDARAVRRTWRHQGAGSVLTEKFSTAIARILEFCQRFQQEFHGRRSTIIGAVRLRPGRTEAFLRRCWARSSKPVGGIFDVTGRFDPDTLPPLQIQGLRAFTLVTGCRFATLQCKLKHDSIQIMENAKRALVSLPNRGPSASYPPAAARLRSFHPM